MSRAADVAGAKVLAAVLEGADSTALRETLDKLRTSSRAPPWYWPVSDGKVSLIAGIYRRSDR